MKSAENSTATATAIVMTKNCCIAENGSTLEHGPVDEYDPYEYTDEKDATSFWSTVAHIVVISAGPGILTIPYTVTQTGYVLGTILSVMLVWLYSHTMRTLIQCEYEICKLKRRPKLSYPEVVYHVFDTGPRALRWFASYGKILSYTIFICIWFGACCYNYIMIGDNVKLVLKNVFDVEVDVYVILTSLAVPFVLLCWIPNLDYLVPVSIAGNVVNAITYGMLVYYMLIADQTPWKYGSAIGSVTKIPILIGSVIFPLNATGIMIPLKNSMKNPTRFNSSFGVLRVSYLPVSVLYACFALICCLKYGDSIERSVIQNLPYDSTFAQLGILLSSFALASQYPLLMYVPIDLVWNNLLKNHKKRWRNEKCGEYTVRTALVTASFVISIAVPNVDLFLSLCGTVGSSIDSLIFPAVMETLVCWKLTAPHRKTRFALITLKNTLILAIALIFVVTGVADSVTSIYHYYTS